MDPETIERLIAMFQEVSPHVWEILMRQVVADVTGFFIWGVAAGTLMTYCVSKLRKADTLVDIMDRTLVNILCYVGFGMGCLFLVISFSEIIVRAINPEFYAVMSVISRLPK